ncbi:hypothetical protein EWE75_13565 [Sphingomonas populi]|uniref:Uncharacterized protein n=1 Tax=Sphingomonas populi TaxID=2484750 RepID=A0A4Q6Y3P9_9SPHN|nr:hypothetical protein [Sphingomonas populi]RZF63999.1 hypothetical protein EWE75_13565 [Sphingomonas populi]
MTTEQTTALRRIMIEAHQFGNMLKLLGAGSEVTAETHLLEDSLDVCAAIAKRIGSDIGALLPNN